MTASVLLLLAIALDVAEPTLRAGAVVEQWQDGALVAAWEIDDIHAAGLRLSDPAGDAVVAVERVVGLPMTYTLAGDGSAGAWIGAVSMGAIGRDLTAIGAPGRYRIPTDGVLVALAEEEPEPAVADDPAMAEGATGRPTEPGDPLSGDTAAAESTERDAAALPAGAVVALSRRGGVTTISVEGSGALVILVPVRGD